MKNRLTVRLAISAIASSFSGVLFGYDIGAIASSNPGLRAHYLLSDSAVGLTVSSALFGTIVGSLLAGFLNDAIDRRGTLKISGVLYAIGSFGTACSNIVPYLATFRVVCGIAIGLISVAAPMYLAEIAPSDLRGRLVGSFQVNISLGVVLGFLMGEAFSLKIPLDMAWRFPLACGTPLALLSEILLFGAAPSPRWLSLKERPVEARAVLANLGSANPTLDQESLSTSIALFGSLGKAKLFSLRHARPLILAVSIAVFNQLTGVNVLLFYILDVFRELSSGRLNGRKDAILLAAFSLVVTIFAVSVIDKLGRKPLLLLGALGMSACLFALPLIQYKGWPVKGIIVVLLCYSLFFAFSQGTLVWVYLSEIFPLPVRARGQSFGSTVHWITNASIITLFPVVIGHLGGTVFALLAVLMVIQFFVILFVYPETKNSNLEALAANISY